MPDTPGTPSTLEVLDYWSARRHLQASIAFAAMARPSMCSMTGRRLWHGLLWAPAHRLHVKSAIVPRYRTMRLIYEVERRFGWDTHGLPAELEVERQLGITDKSIRGHG